MKIEFYINKHIKINFLIVLILTVFTAASILCIPLSTHKNNPVDKDLKSVRLPVIMYHLVSSGTAIQNNFTVSAATFEEDLKYIESNGYTTVLIKDLVDYTEGKAELPSKPILLTFDDGAYNNYLYAFPLAKKYNAKFVFSPICKETERYTQITDENPGYAHANWEKIKEMSNSGLVEVQNHTYNMHSSKKPRIGCTKKYGETKNKYRESLVKDLSTAQQLIKDNVGSEPTAFFYPFGACSKCSEEIIKSLGFKATFLCESKINCISKDPACLFEMGRFLRPPKISAKIFFSKFEKK